MHIRACLEQHPDHLHMPVLAGNVEGGGPILQHIPAETGHDLLHRSATPCHHSRHHASCRRVLPSSLPSYTLPCAAYLLSSMHIRACLKQHPDHRYVPVEAGNVKGGTPILQHIPTETGHDLLHPPRNYTRHHNSCRRALPPSICPNCHTTPCLASPTFLAACTSAPALNSTLITATCPFWLAM